MEDDDFSLSLPDQFISQIDCGNDDISETGSVYSSSLFSSYSQTPLSQSTIQNWDSSQTTISQGLTPTPRPQEPSTPKYDYQPSHLTFDLSQDITGNLDANVKPHEEPEESHNSYHSYHGSQKSLNLLEDESNSNRGGISEDSFGKIQSNPYLEGISYPQVLGDGMKPSSLNEKHTGMHEMWEQSQSSTPIHDLKPLSIEIGDVSLDIASTSAHNVSHLLDDEFEESSNERPLPEEETSNLSYNDEDWGEVKPEGETVKQKSKDYLPASIQWDVDWAYEEIDSLKAKDIILERIEAIFAKMCTDILQRRYPMLSMLQRDVHGNLVERTINFHNRTSRYKFAVVIKVLRKIYNLMKGDAIITRRDLYYEHVNFFKDQSVAEAGITDAAMVLRVNPIYLPFQSSTKGFVAAGENVYLKYFNDMNMEKNVYLTSKGGSMPQMSAILGWKQVQSNAKFILVVEKDTVFTRLCHDGVFDYLEQPCIMITGKGYPDKATQAFACKLNQDLRIPVFALVDADPFGFEIAATYRWGSAVTTKIPGYNAQITVPDLILLGVMPSEIEKYGIPQTCKIPLSDMDKRKLDTLIPRLLLEGATTWGAELQKLKENEYKTEIEALNVLGPKFLSRIYLPTKVQECLRQIEQMTSYSQQAPAPWDMEFNAMYPDFGRD